MDPKEIIAVFQKFLEDQEKRTRERVTQEEASAEKILAEPQEDPRTVWIKATADKIIKFVGDAGAEHNEIYPNNRVGIEDLFSSVVRAGVLIKSFQKSQEGK